MAKKARRKLEDEEEAAFEFPAFDEEAFATKEFELGGGVLIVGILTLAMGLFSWALTLVGLIVYVPLGLGILVLAASPFIIRRVRERASLYTTGDWAGLLFLEFFGWFALWFALLDLVPVPH